MVGASPPHAASVRAIVRRTRKVGAAPSGLKDARLAGSPRRRAIFAALRAVTELAQQPRGVRLPGMLHHKAAPEAVGELG